MKNCIIWNRLKCGIYKPECHDESMATLMLFFEDGLPFQTYINFLENEFQQKLSGNISFMEKKGLEISIHMSDYVFPNMPPFTTTIDSMIVILQEYEKLYFRGVDTIEITLEDDKLTIKGDWNH